MCWDIFCGNRRITCIDFSYGNPAGGYYTFWLSPSCFGLAIWYGFRGASPFTSTAAIDTEKIHEQKENARLFQAAIGVIEQMVDDM
jgi:hypothetical protein